MAARKHKHPRLRAILNEIAQLSAEIQKLSEEGIDVDAINAALTQLNTDVDALIAKSAGAITPAQAKAIADGLTALSKKVTDATTAV